MPMADSYLAKKRVPRSLAVECVGHAQIPIDIDIKIPAAKIKIHARKYKTNKMTDNNNKNEHIEQQ